MKVEQLAQRLLLVQIGVTVVLALGWGFYSGASEAIAVLYGGAISVILARMHKYGVCKAQDKALHDPDAGMMIIYMGAAIRFVLLGIMLGVGFGLLKLSPYPTLAGFVLAQLGYLYLAKR